MKYIACLAYSFATRIVSIGTRNVSASVGGIAFMLGFALISGNALYAQNGNHPDPIWMTRDHMVTKSVSNKNSARIRPIPVRTQRISIKRVPVPTVNPVSGTEELSNKALLKNIQQVLAEMNLYYGAVDGLYGSETRGAIVRLQSILDIEQTGRPSPGLLKLVRSASHPRSKDVKSAHLGKPGTIGSPANGGTMVRKIQTGLIRFGAEGVVVDGIYGERTASAIRKFQQRYKLAIDGKPNKDVLRKLRQIGALENT